MEISEIRAAFTLSESRVEKLRSFRDERLNTIQSQIGIPAFGGAKRIIHLFTYQPIWSSSCHYLVLV
jgi:hypothetical protein